MSKISILKEEKFSLKTLNKYATIMALGNGYLGLRSTLEENYEQCRGMFVAGIYNKFTENDVNELVNLPDLVGIKIELDGEVFNLLSGKIISYDRTLEMLTGELVREIVWENANGKRFQFSFRRFVSRDDLHLVATKISVTVLNGDASIKLKTGIDAQMTNFGKQHLIEENILVIEKKILHATYRTSSSDNLIAIASTCVVPESSHVDFAAKNRKLLANVSDNLKVNEPYIIEKLNSVYTSLDKNVEDIASECIKAVESYIQSGYDKLRDNSAETWLGFWANKRVVVDSKDAVDQLAIDFSMYHVDIMTPAHDERFSVGAKGLTGEGYKGHVFWDTEIFIAPLHMYTDPVIAKNLLRYRFLHINEAKEKAIANSYNGTLFPWESAFTGKEETPEYAAININTGKRQKIASAIAEHHIVADIAFAVVQYFNSTLDEEFMANEGLELLKETASFWISRTVSENGKLSIKDVIGPDEYTEHIDNNAYTNYLASYNVQQAIRFMRKFNKVDEDLMAKANEFLEKIYLPVPNEDGIIPQDDTFLSKPEIDLSKYKMSQGSQGILLDYARHDVNEMQILKQADVVMLMYLLPNLFSADVVEKNLKYYEEHTIHDSSLSKAIHSIVASRCGEMELSYRFFQEACLIDLGPNPNSSDEGIHAASLGANWLAIIFGFANIVVDKEVLSIMPKLPINWNTLTFPFSWQGANLEFTITKDNVTVAKKSGPDISIEISGELFIVSDRVSC